MSTYCDLLEICSIIPNSVIIPNEANNTIIEHIVCDSRFATANSIFVATVKDSLDSHIFLEKAVANGATAVVINEHREVEFSRITVPKILVNDTNEAFNIIAKAWSGLYLGADNIDISYHDSQHDKDEQLEMSITDPTIAATIGSETRFSVLRNIIESNLTLAVFAMSLIVTALSVYITSYADWNSKLLELSRLKLEIKLAKQREIMLEKEVSMYELSASSKARKKGMRTVHGNSVRFISD